MTNVCRGLVAVMLAGLVQTAAAAELLPRIFFSPADRAAIVEHRRQAPSTATGSEPASASVSATAPAAALRLDGISIAQRGQTFAWFSGSRYADGSTLGASRLQITRDGVRLKGANGRTRMIRVGESLGRAP